MLPEGIFARTEGLRDASSRKQVRPRDHPLQFIRAERRRRPLLFGDLGLQYGVEIETARRGVHRPFDRLRLVTRLARALVPGYERRHPGPARLATADPPFNPPNTTAPAT